MQIVLTTTECVPFAKTGGLADVCGALPRELAARGHDVSVWMPAFRQVHAAGLPIDDTGLSCSVPVGTKQVDARILRSTLPESDVPVYFIAQDHYFDRSGLYQDGDQDYRDNCERFVFFCRAVIESLPLLGLQPDLIHANDWQTGLIPAYLRTEYADQRGFEQIATLFTIHNLAYQGDFWHWDMVLTGIDWKYFNWRQMEFYGNLNLLKTGLVFADRINTVSPRYAREIQTPELGCGMHELLAHRSDDLSGIINGVDYQVWNPATDPYLAANYDVQSYAEGKRVCKAALQAELGLPEAPQIPLIGLVGRLVDQKGLDLVAQVMQEWVQTADVQWAILGTGQQKYQEWLERLAAEHPDRVGVRIGYSNELAHRIEAGADLFLMPSRYEPCGLNQLYSLRYGTVPVVRETGGLADTVVDAQEATWDDSTATGFVFRDYEARSLSETLWRACETYSDATKWSQLVTTGMEQDWSWSASAAQYETLYAATRDSRTHPLQA